MWWHYFVVFYAIVVARAERSTLCDDGKPLDSTCHLPTIRCNAKELWALQNGCFVCVDATTCLAIKEQTLPKANGKDMSMLLQDQVDASPEALNQAAIMTSAHAEEVTSNDVKHARVATWLFAVPVCLALISLGFAARTHLPRPRFKRLHGHNRLEDSPLFEENINPFCIETGGNDLSHSESEEAHFLGDTSTMNEALKEAKE